LPVERTVDRVIHLFALLLGAGLLGLLPFQNHRRIPGGYFQLAAALGGLAVLLALATGPRGAAGAPSAAARPATGALLVLAAVYAALVWSGWVARARGIAWLLLPAALLAIGVEGGMPPSTAAWRGSLTLVAGAGLLGAVTQALLLGHSYVSAPGLPISHLRRLTTLAAAFVVARLAAFVLAAPAAAAGGPGGGGGGGLAHVSAFDAAAVLESNLPLLAMRLLLGILVPGILAWMIDRTVRIRATKSATGLLYVAFIFVLFGELVAAYLFALTGIPT
jgi:hypothetical protein